MEFKSQICTTKEQSERLLKLGLKKETADMMYITDGRVPEEYRRYDLVPEYYESCFEDIVHIPAWSFGRLWELYWSNKVVCDCLFGCRKHMNPYAKMIALIEYDIEDGIFNKDYLEDEIK